MKSRMLYPLITILLRLSWQFDQLKMSAGKLESLNAARDACRSCFEPPCMPGWSKRLASKPLHIDSAFFYFRTHPPSTYAHVYIVYSISHMLRTCSPSVDQRSDCIWVPPTQSQLTVDTLPHWDPKGLTAFCPMTC